MSDLTQGSMANFSCTIGHWSGAAVPHDITIGEIAYWPARNPQGNATKPQDTIEWKALAPCCENPKNITKEPNDCVLWCELPRDRFPPNPPYDPPREGKYIDRFNECIKANMLEDGNGLATAVRYPNNANKTDDSKPSSSASSSVPSATTGTPNAGETGKSAAVPVLKMPSVLSLGLVTVMAGVYAILS
ncbi:hypothetical protein PG993_005109 [Apiospora rasikravindrae]|uniref:Uncharacterized protein n=1 Tax=Apiospora rasikravindrae TaxID=990691 RepID=A0ABR1TEM7_9PEZI